MSRCEHSDDLRKASTDLRCPLCMEAEIERLRAEIDKLSRGLPATLDANERLRADKDNWEKVCAAAFKEQFRLDAEIVQLRLVLQDLVDRWADERGMDQEIERARALLIENALRSPADGDVRHALEGKITWRE